MAVEEFYDAELIWHSDICPDSNKVMNHHWSQSIPIGDLTEACPGELEVPSIITCGFPCQAVSTSGLGEGIESDKWLFDDIITFLCALDHLPQKVIFENVANLISHDNGKTGLHVFRQIAQLGFDVKWCVLRAADAGLPHNRKRFFAVATNSNRVSGKKQDIRTRKGNREIQRFHWKFGNDTERHRVPVFTSEHGTLQAFHEYAQAIEEWEIKSGEPSPNPISTSGKAISEEFVRWMMGYPKGWLDIEGITRSAKLKLLGNAVCPQQALLALQTIEELECP